MTTFTNHQKLLAIALEEARSGLAQGDIPVGAALFSADGILPDRGHNRRIQEADPSSHVEKNAFHKDGRLKTCCDKILITTLKP